MFIVFLLILDIHTTHCQTTTTTTTTAGPNLVYGCSFLNSTYLTSAAVSDQFEFPNRTSIILTASYASPTSSLSISTFELGLIYTFGASNPLVPFPVLLNCTSIVRSCQLTIMAGSTSISRDAEPIRVQLTQFNYTSTLISPNQMGLYLKEGLYQLSDCLLNDGQLITEQNTTFYIRIKYEKSAGSSCNPSSDTCGSPSLTSCSSLSATCTCLSTSSLVSYTNLSLCTDTMTSSNCSIFPTRCVTLCHSTTNTLCICPMDTLKIQRNNLYVCELPVNSFNCSSNDNIRRCPLGQACLNGQCSDDILTTTMKTNISDASNDQTLRIVLGVLVGLFGTSLIIAIGVFCWLRQRQKRHRMKTEKSLTPTSSSSTSSLYISPIQQQDYPSNDTIYQLPLDNNSYRRISSIYRTDSFRQAVISGHKRTNQTIEHISAKRDSFIERSSHHKEDIGSPIYSTLDYVVPSQSRKYRNSNKTNNDVYQVINTSSSTATLTHAV
ncbi:unnamed protein product [Rotaria socialis]|uniref:Uncharacterized protein n=1 Tax=Rotaria socialis TaxID=392032 RepID=A0A820YXM2_9BILA|nr:unnamed protein product [Rotaria socialis]CAF3437459.1 unnamed protein product [Rotaria socialis]CAF4155033.1 unnamed protein product [Rotaria socialis]CAF4555315.1 unnamed protein product [Rotaria socialis]